MESKGSRTGEICPKLLDLIPGKGRERIMRGDHEGRSFVVSEEKKLELKLGPPREEDWFMNENNQTRETFHQQSPLSLGCFSSMASQNPNSPFNGNLSPWCSTSSQSPSPSSFQATHHHHQQQQQQHSFLGFPSIPQNLPVLAKESSQICNKKLLELQNSEKKACSPAASPTVNTAVNTNNSSQKRTAPAPVVGWPPIRSFRKNLANSSSSKPAPESQNGAPSKDSTTIVKPETCTRKGLFVKINMDGVPIGRKVDLKAYDSYEKLSSAVDELFRGLLSAQRDSSANQHVDEVSEITGILDGSGEYTLVYEDNEGDRMLVGDVPWDMFASTVKRLRVLKSSELSTLHLGSNKQGKTHVTGVQ